MCSPFDAHPPELPAGRGLPRLAGASSAQTLELTSADGTRFSAAFAPSVDDAQAGVVILPDVRGLYPFYVELAERFAAAGHPAIVLDYFGRTAGLGPRGDDFDFWPHVMQTTVETVQADLAAAEAELLERSGVRAVVTVGFCFGGMHSLLAGTSDALATEAVVAFYGALDGTRFELAGPLQRAAEIQVPVLGLYGEADQGIPVEQVRAFEEQLTVAHEIQLYAGAPHSFFDRAFTEHAAACEDAWGRVLDFTGAVGRGLPA